MNNEQNMTQNIDQTIQTAAEQATAAQTAAEQKLAKKKLTRRIFIGGGLGALAVVGGGAGWAYNRYLAEHTEIEDTTAYEAAVAQANASASGSATADPTELTGVKVNGQSLTANEGSITITSNTTGSGSDAVVSFVADIKLDNATLLRSAFANNKFGQNIIDTPSNIASEHNGIWAINGDYYGFRTTGIVIRNGVVYRDAGAREGLAFYRDGSVKLYDETATNAQTLVNEGVWNTPPSARHWSRTPRLSTVSTASRWTPTLVTTPSRATSRELAWVCLAPTTWSSSWLTAAPPTIRAA